MTPQDPVSRAVAAYYAALDCSPPCGAHEAMGKALAEYEAAHWRPISEAPRDGTMIDVWRGWTEERPLLPVGRVPNVRWMENGWAYLARSWWHSLEDGVTHFRPLPPPPGGRPMTPTPEHIEAVARYLCRMYIFPEDPDDPFPGWLAYKEDAERIVGIVARAALSVPPPPATDAQVDAAAREGRVEKNRWSLWGPSGDGWTAVWQDSPVHVVRKSWPFGTAAEIVRQEYQALVDHAAMRAALESHACARAALDAAGRV